jgi:hypothetical protein
VTHGGIGKPDIVSDRPWQAVALPPQHGHADFARAAENVALPCYPVEIIEGGARRRIMRAAAHRFFGGVRCVSVSPVAGGAR